MRLIVLARPRNRRRNAMATDGAIDVAMRWKLTVREPFRLVRTVRLHFNRQGHVVGHGVGFHRPILHGCGTGEAMTSAANTPAAALIARSLPYAPTRRGVHDGPADSFTMRVQLIEARWPPIAPRGLGLWPALAHSRGSRPL